MAVVEVTAENFDEMIDAEYAVVDCYGTFCSACVMLEPVYEGVADDMAAIRFLKVNLDENEALMERYGIEAMPTLLYFRKGQLVNRSLGSMGREELLEYMAQLLYRQEP